jgi:hypothetical protein
MFKQIKNIYLSILEIKFNVFPNGMPYGFKFILCIPIIDCMYACLDQLGKLYSWEYIKAKF